MKGNCNVYFYGCTNLNEVCLTGSNIVIGEHVFSSSGLTKITLGEGVVSVGANAFRGISKAKEIEILNPNINISSASFFATGDGTNGCSLYSKQLEFSGFANTNISSVTLDGTTKLGYRSFYNCIYLTTIQITETLVEISEGSFQMCISLESVQLPDGTFL